LLVLWLDNFTRACLEGAVPGQPGSVERTDWLAPDARLPLATSARCLLRNECCFWSRGGEAQLHIGGHAALLRRIHLGPDWQTATTEPRCQRIHFSQGTASLPPWYVSRWV